MGHNFTYYILVRDKDSNTFVEKERHGAYNYVGQLMQDPQSGMIKESDKYIKKMKSDFNRIFDGQIKFVNEYWSYLANFLENLESYNLISEVIKNGKNNEHEKELYDFLNICRKYLKYSTNDVKINLVITY